MQDLINTKDTTTCLGKPCTYSICKLPLLIWSEEKLVCSVGIKLDAHNENSQRRGPNMAETQLCQST